MATKFKQFIDLEGLKTLWSKIKGTFISSGGTYLEVTKTDGTATVDIKASQIAKGSDTSKVSLVTDGYVLDQIQENASERIPESEIDDAIAGKAAPTA